MFSRLSEKLQAIFKDLSGQGHITEGNITAALREIRIALLDADVHYKVVKQFIAQVKEKALGKEVLLSITPGQQITKVFHDELVTLLGQPSSGLNLTKKPAHILMVGLNGAGKTTSCAKLANYLKSQQLCPILVACDLIRPAAIKQLATLAEKIQIPIFKPPSTSKNILSHIPAALDWCKAQGPNYIAIFDTAGRQEINQPLINELKSLKELLEPKEILLVCDAGTGQQAVSVAEHFNKALEITGLILTKLDGDARGGAALSLRQITNQPIKFTGTGEKIECFELFYPERLASRILGMGDIVSLVEKASEAMSEAEAKRMEEKLRTASFTLTDFLQQFKMIRKLGPLENLVGMLGLPQAKDLQVSEKQITSVEAIILSMTPKEREHPEILNAKRRQRIAKGSGTTVTEINSLIRRYEEMRKTMKAPKMKKLLSQFKAGGKNPDLGSFFR